MSWQEQWTGQGRRSSERVSEDQRELEKLRSKLAPLSPEVLLASINQKYMEGRGEIVEVGRVSKGTYASAHPLRQENTVYFNNTFAGYALVRIDQSSINQHDLSDDGSATGVIYDGIAIGYRRNGQYFVSQVKHARYDATVGYQCGSGKGHVLQASEEKTLGEAAHEQLTAAAKALQGE